VNRRERPVPPPLEGNDQLITAVITAGFVVALIVLLIVRDSLAPADRWWIWVAAFGTGLGVFGLAYVPHLKRSRERAAERRRAALEAAGYHSATDITVVDSRGTDGIGTDSAGTDGTATHSTAADSTGSDVTARPQ
jgi:hypothetical protein